MIHDCHNPRMTAVCEKELESSGTPAAAAPTVCESFSVCLPFGGSLTSDGQCVSYDPPTPPPDGVYDKIVIANGCIVDAQKADIPLYTAAPCAPVAGDCEGGNGGGGGGTITPSSQAGNLLTTDAAGRPLVRLNVQSGSGISVRGSGTAADPIVISAGTGGGGLYITSLNSSIKASGNGTAASPIKIEHAKGLATTVGGMQFDSQGHLISYSEPAPGASTVKALVAGDGIDVADNNGIATVSIANPANNLNGQYVFGGYKVDLDLKNRIFRVEQDITTAAGTYYFADKNVELNGYGSIENIEDSYSNSVLFHHTFKGSDIGDIRELIAHFELRAPSRIRVCYRCLCAAANANRLTCKLDNIELPLLNRFAAITGLGERVVSEGLTPPDTRSVTYVTEYDETYYWMNGGAVYSVGRHDVRFIIPLGESFETYYNPLITIEAVSPVE